MASVLEKGRNYSVDVHFENVLKEENIQNGIKFVTLEINKNTVKAFVSGKALMYQREKDGNI